MVFALSNGKEISYELHLFAVYWIGIKEYPDGMMRYHSNNDTLNFTAKDENTNSTETKCMALDTLSKKWESASCNAKKPFLCERKEKGMYFRIYLAQFVIKSQLTVYIYARFICTLRSDLEGTL